MSIKITDDCINCGACEPECPNNAIYENGQVWKYSEGTSLSGGFKNHLKEEKNADEKNKPLSEEYFFIVSDKCTECVGFHEEPQCAAVCPVDCCVPDENHKEDKDTLNFKRELLHGK